MEKNAFEIASLIDNILSELRQKLADKNVFVIREYQDGFLQITADKYRVAQVLYSLFDNALTLGKPGGHILIRIRRKCNMAMIDVNVESTGDFKETSGKSQSAVGQNDWMQQELEISKGIARDHGGYLVVSNDENGSLKFTLSLPSGSEGNGKFIENNMVLNIEQNGGKKNKFEMAGSKLGTIAVLDDQYSSLIGIMNIVNAGGYTVKGYLDAEEGLADIFANRKTDIVIADMMLRIPGQEICQKIRKDFSLSEIPILILTARTTGDSTLLCLRAGANEVLRKPFGREELLARVDTLIRLKTTAQQAIHNEVAMLQAQINPHFLHNAMSALAAYCYEDPEKASDAIISLSDYLQYSFDFQPDTEEIPLSKEVELVEAYLSVEKLRFREKLRYDIRMDLSIGGFPPFTIQPLVENAVRHGISKKEGGGNVEILGEKTDSGYKVTVRDDGIGMDTETLDRVLRGKKSPDFGIGLSNVRERLKKKYGTDLMIESEEGKGTQVSFSIETEAGKC